MAGRGKPTKRDQSIGSYEREYPFETRCLLCWAVKVHKVWAGTVCTDHVERDDGTAGACGGRLTYTRSPFKRPARGGQLAVDALVVAPTLPAEYLPTGTGARTPLIERE